LGSQKTQMGLAKVNQDRLNLFKAWFKTSLVHKDVDPALWMMRYLFERFEYNSEQRLWLCWLYGTTYNLPTAWVVSNEFPDFDLVGQERLEAWSKANHARLRYQTDTKWNKGHLPAQYASYRKVINEIAPTQGAAFRLLTQSGNRADNFKSVWQAMSKCHKFGRYSLWFYLQALAECCSLNIAPDSLMLADESGSRSHRAGLLFALGLEDYDRDGITKDKHLIDALEDISSDILDDVQKARPEASYFLMETALCSFKKIWRRNDSRYIGYYLDRQSEEVMRAEADGWSGIDWRPLWDGRMANLTSRLQGRRKIDKRFPLFLDTRTLPVAQ